MSMPIEDRLTIDNLNVLSDYYLKFLDTHQNEGITHYYIYYKNTASVRFVFGIGLNQTQDYNQFTLPLYLCEFSLRNPNTNENLTSQTFDFTTSINNCTYEQGQGSYDFPLNYNSGSSTYKYYASDLYQENYLDYNTYKTIEIEPNPSPSPSPEPSTTEFGDINPYFWILPSFILMLIFMYKFLDKIFARGD